MQPIRKRAVVFWCSALLGLVWLACGCDSRPAADPASPPAPARQLAEGETWDAIFMQGAKVGSMHTRQATVERDGRTLLRTESKLIMRIHRGGQTSEQLIEQAVEELPSGEIVRLECVMRQGQQPLTVEATIDGAVLRTTITSAGRASQHETPWNANNGGYFAVERSLQQHPLRPGEQRAVEGLQAPANQPVTAELVARQRELVTLLDGQRELLRVDATEYAVGAPPIRSTRWIDEQGHTHKMELDMAALVMTAYRTTRDRALAEDDQPPVDLNRLALVAIDRPLRDIHAARRARYRVTLAEGDPRDMFPSSGDQTVRTEQPHVAELLVQPRRLTDPAPAGPVGPPIAEAPPTAADRQPSRMVQSDDERIARMAREAVSDAATDADRALRLERYVRQQMTNVDFSQAFASAAEVAETLQGDCTEHAVLLAALARAVDIPARVAVGLVYVHAPGAPPGFGYHMWAELFVDGRWVALDGTLGRGGIGAGHLKVAHSSLADGDNFGSLLTIVTLLGQLQIEVLEPSAE